MDTTSDINENSSFDLYLQEIEGVDDYWGPTFRYTLPLIYNSLLNNDF